MLFFKFYYDFSINFFEQDEKQSTVDVLVERKKEERKREKGKIDK